MKIAGIDIAKLVSDSIDGQLLPITLERHTAGNYDPVASAETNASVETYESEGIIQDFNSERADDAVDEEFDHEILIIAHKLGTVPKSGDRLTIEEKTFTVTGKPDRDPAGATYIVKVNK